MRVRKAQCSISSIGTPKADANGTSKYSLPRASLGSAENGNITQQRTARSLRNIRTNWGQLCRSFAEEGQVLASFFTSR